MRARRILVVSASAGMGHVSAGEALRGALAARGAVVEHVDVLDLAPRWIARAYAGSFELLARRAPRLWRGVYRWSDGPDADAARWGPLARRLLFRAFRERLDAYAPDACLCTHFLPAQLASGDATLPPFGLVVTDYALHRYWVQPHLRDCFTGTAALAEEARLRLPSTRVHAVGIPIRSGFGAVGTSLTVRERLDLPADRPIALVVGGGMGLAIEAMTRSALAAAVPGLRVVAVCGRNDAARERLAAVSGRAGRLTVRGYVNDLEHWMAAADVVVSKPGGLTTTEALAVGRPLVLTRPLPGHEEANAATLVRAGAALSTPRPAGVGACLERIFGDPALRLTLTSHARAMGAPDAADHIARTVLADSAAPAAA